MPPGQDVMQDKMDPIELIEEPTQTDFYQPEKKDPDTPYVVYRLYSASLKNRTYFKKLLSYM